MEPRARRSASRFKRAKVLRNPGGGFTYDEVDFKSASKEQR